ncbi:MAG: magnesium transporter [Candidatus Omnitrophica bacterium]|nr:magnesium transporter [Candidatus Omnitrophota bacterium]
MTDHTEEQKEIQTPEERIRKIEELLGNSRDEDLRNILRDMAPEDIAEILGEFSQEDKLRIFNLLNDENAAVVLDDTDPQTRLQILQKVDIDKLARVLDEMPVDEAADVVEEIPEKDREDILDLMEEKDAEEVEEILSYPEDSAARVMNPELISVTRDSDVENAIHHIRSLEIDEEVFSIYVVDKKKRLCGVVPVSKLLTAPKGTLIENIMEEDAHSVFAGDDREKAALVMKKYDVPSLAVVDDTGELVGRITADDIIDVIDEEHAEDISHMTGTIEEEKGTESALRATQNRLPWLITCMLGSIVTGLVIRMFGVTLAETIALVSFIPVITATGGNSGVQASTVVVREIALGTMNFGKIGEEVWRQLKIALCLGLVCGILLTFLANIWWKNSLIGYIVGFSIFLVVIWSNFVGVLTPVIFKKIRVDPAIASGPLITTMNDVVGVFIYLNIATIMLR